MLKGVNEDTKKCFHSRFWKIYANRESCCYYGVCHLQLRYKTMFHRTNVVIPALHNAGGKCFIEMFYFYVSKIPCKKSSPLSSTLTNELKFKINPVGGPVCSKSPTLVSESFRRIRSPQSNRLIDEGSAPLVINSF